MLREEIDCFDLLYEKTMFVMWSPHPRAAGGSHPWALLETQGSGGIHVEMQAVPAAVGWDCNTHCPSQIILAYQFPYFNIQASHCGIFTCRSIGCAGKDYLCVQTCI